MLNVGIYVERLGHFEDYRTSLRPHHCLFGLRRFPLARQSHVV